MALVIGIDPGSLFTGFALLQFEKGARDLRVITAGRISLKDKDLSARLSVLYQEVTALIAQYQPDCAAIESVFSKHPQSALTLGHARGAILVALAQHALPIHEYAPRHVKKSIVGTGSAEKAQVAMMVKQQLKLSGEMPEDTTDALAVALCHACQMPLPKPVG